MSTLDGTVGTSCLVSEIAAKLASGASEIEGVHERMVAFLDSQAESTLKDLAAATSGYSPVEWGALAITIHRFDWYEREDIECHIPFDEFYLRSAMQMVPMLVIEQERYEEDFKGVAYSVHACIDALTDSLSDDPDVVKYCCAYELLSTYGMGGDISREAMTWLHENAVKVIQNPESFFTGPGFDVEKAKEILAVESVPMRQGVL